MLIYMKEPVREFNLARSPAHSLALTIAVIGTIIIGILPAWFLEMAKAAIFHI
jgi:NADH:ubiquinone oxidoreductase subunit 2 (subunit N)